MKALVRNDGARARRAAAELGPFGIRVNTINASITPSFAVPAAAPEGGLVLVRLLHQRQEDTVSSIKLFLGIDSPRIAYSASPRYQHSR